MILLEYRGRGGCGVSGSTLTFVKIAVSRTFASCEDTASPTYTGSCIATVAGPEDLSSSPGLPAAIVNALPRRSIRIRTGPLGRSVSPQFARPGGTILQRG